MADAPPTTHPPDAGRTTRRFFAFQELLGSPELARFYTDLLVNSPTTVPAVRDRQDFSKSTAYKYANALAELGVATELDDHEDGSALWRAEPVTGTWTGETTLEFGPVVVAVYGATSVDDDLELFVDRHGKAALAPAVSATIDYLAGNTTRRGVADDLGVPAVEAIAVTQAIEAIVGAVREHDPTLDHVTFKVDVDDRTVERGPYRRSDE